MDMVNKNTERVLNHDLQELKVAGNKLVDIAGHPVRLAGVNICGMEWLVLGENTVKSTIEAFDNWNCNVIRVPLNQDFWFGYGPDQEADFTVHRDIFDQVVQEAAKRKKYIIADLHWSDRGVWGQEYGQQRMPDDNSLTFWQSICSLYGNNPYVLFGLYNEAHDISWEVWKNGGEVDDEAGTYHTPGHQQLVQAVRDIGARNICIVGGLDWGYDLTGIKNGYALTDRNTADTFSGNGILYDAHVYPFKYDWDKYVKCIKGDYPVLIGECGWFDPQWYRDNIDTSWHSEPYATWCPKLIQWIEENEFNWIAWSFHVNAEPNILADWYYNPTPDWGVYAKSALLGRKIEALL